MWKQTHGVAVIRNTYISNGPKQMTVLAGDPIEVFEETNDWLLGTNLLTQKSGIFPKAVSNFIKMPKIENQEYLAMPEDLLIYDAYLTLNVALQQYQTLPATYAMQVFDAIQDVIHIFETFDDRTKASLTEFSHTSLGLKIKTIRDCLGLPDTFRCGNYSPITVSSWGLEHYLSRFALIPQHKAKSTEHVMITTRVNVKNLLQPQLFRFVLWSANQYYYPFASRQFSTLLTPDKTEIELQFNQLEEQIFNSPLYLVIFVDHLKAATKDQPETRTPRCCAILQLKFRQNPYEKSFSLSGGSYAYGQDYQPNLFASVINGIQNLQEDSIAFNVVCTAYIGQYDMMKSNPKKNQFIVAPYKNPSIVPLGFNDSSMTFRFINIEQDASRNAFKFTIRILDAAKNEFLPVMPKLIQIDQSTAYSDREWTSLVIKGQKELTLDEMCSIDISNYEKFLNNIYICIEFLRTGHLGKSLSAFGQTVIKVTNEKGEFQIGGDGKYPIYALSYKGNSPNPKDFVLDASKSPKQLGSVTINISTTSDRLATNRDISTIISTNETPNISANLKAIQGLKIHDWIPFTRRLFTRLITIIASKSNDSPAALEALLNCCYKVFSDNKYEHYSGVLFDYIDTEITPNMRMQGDQLKEVYKSILSELSKAIAQDKKGDANYIPALLSTHFLVELCTKLFIICKNGIKAFFTSCVDPIIKRMAAVVTETDFPENKKTIIVTNASKIVLALNPIYTSQQIAQMFLDVYNAGGKVEKDSSPDLLESKITLLSGLSSCQLWNDDVISNTWLPEFKHDIAIIANSDPKLELKVIDALANIFFTSRNTFALNFFDIILRNFESNNKMEICYFIAALINQFPKLVSIESAFRFLSSPVVEPTLKLFLTIFIIQENKMKLAQRMRTKGKDSDTKMDIFKTCLTAACYAATPAGIPLDLQIQRKTYDVGGRFDVLTDLYMELPTNEAASPSLFGEIIHAYTYYESESLRTMFFYIIDSLFAQGTKFEEIFFMLFPVFKQYANLPHFTNLSKIFTASKKEHESLCQRCLECVHGVRNARLPNNKQNQHLLVEAYNNLANLGRELKSREITVSNLCQIAAIHENYKMKLEQAYTLRQILDEFPIDNDVKVNIPVAQSKNGRTLWVELLKKMVGLYMEESQDEYALDVLKDFRAKIVKKFRHFELLPEIYDLEAQVYKNIISGQRNYSKFYRVNFSSNHKFEESGKTYIYRRPSTVPYTEFSNEMKQMFPDAVVMDRSSLINSSNARMVIQIETVFPASENEEKDVLYRSESGKPEFIQKWEVNKCPCIFKADLQKISDTKYTMEFHHTEQCFPNIASRMVITKNITKDVSPLEAVCLQAIKEIMKLISDENTTSRDINLDLLHLNGTIGAIGKRGIVEAANQYLKDTYVRLNPQQKRNVEEFRNVLKQLLEVVNRRIEDIRQQADLTNPTFAKAFEAAKIQYDQLSENLGKYLN